ncbi:MAG: regulatory protein RecX [Dehalococcoidia bacterium]
MADSDLVLNAALRLLSYRPRGQEELRRRLLRRFPQEAVEPVLAQLQQQGLLDDAAFARFWQESRERSRPRSALLVRQELLRLGVDRETADAAVAGLDDEENAYRAGAKLLRSVRAADYEEFRRQLFPRLQRRGFSPAVIRQATARLWEERQQAEASLEG